MRYTTKTEYGIIALGYMALQPKGACVTVREIAKAENFSAAYIEKIFQKLRSAGIVKSLQGKVGGYVLAREPKRITLRQVIEALEGATFEVFCGTDVVCGHSKLCGLGPVWVKTKLFLDEFFDSITLSSLAKAAKRE